MQTPGNEEAKGERRLTVGGKSRGVEKRKVEREKYKTRLPSISTGKVNEGWSQMSEKRDVERKEGKGKEIYKNVVTFN